MHLLLRCNKVRFSRVETHISNVDSYLPLMSGAGTKICLSNLPGLNKASSNISTLLVAASITTPTSDLKPEIMKHLMSRCMIFPTMWYVLPAKA